MPSRSVLSQCALERPAILVTNQHSLLDGSILRWPRTRITTNDGSDLELKPRPVDVPVTRALGEWALGRDSQIETAVKELLTLVEKRTARQRLPIRRRPWKFVITAAGRRRRVFRNLLACFGLA